MLLGRVVTDAHFLRLAHNSREAGLPKLMLLRPLGRTFVIMGYNFNNRELLEVTDIKIFNLSFVNKVPIAASRTVISKLNSEIYPLLYFMLYRPLDGMINILSKHMTCQDSGILCIFRPMKLLAQRAVQCKIQHSWQADRK